MGQQPIGKHLLVTAGKHLEGLVPLSIDQQRSCAMGLQRPIIDP
jgi:hypothetical protein